MIQREGDRETQEEDGGYKTEKQRDRQRESRQTRKERELMRDYFFLLKKVFMVSVQ